MRKASTGQFQSQTSTGLELEKILAWCEHHQADPASQESTKSTNVSPKSMELSEWDRELFEVPSNLVFGIILGANFLDIPEVVDMGCEVIANMVKGKTSEEIRLHFDIADDLTAEEKANIRKDNEWAEKH